MDDQVRPGDGRKTVEREVRNLQWMFDSLMGIPQAIDRTQLGQAIRIARDTNFVRLMPQAGFASVSELGMVTAQAGWKHTLRSIPVLSDFKRNALTGKLGRDEVEDLEYMFTVGTDYLRGSGTNMRSPGAASATLEPGLNGTLDAVERGLKLATRATSAMSLSPVTTIEERLALKAGLSKFRSAALQDEPLTRQRMALLGLSPEMQGRVLSEIRTHTGKVKSPETGREVEILGLDKWDEQVRSAFEFAMDTWVRRMIQQNDLGQMNAFLGNSLAKLFFQFRSFSLGAWSKNTLSNLHMRDTESLNMVWATSAFGGLAYVTQTYLQSLGRPDATKFLEERLSDQKVAAALFQRAGWSSLLPGPVDFAAGLVGLDPLFDTRSTGQPTQGWAANPTTGLIDSVYQGARGLGKAAQGDGYSSQDFRNLSRAVNPFHMFPLVMQTVSATSGAFPER